MSPKTSTRPWLFLDLGNVVLDIDKRRASALFYSTTGLPHEEFDWVFFGSGLLDDFNLGRISEEAFLLRVQGDLRYRGSELSDDAIRRIWTSMLVPVPGTEEWLLEVEPKLEGIWVVSDINPIHWRAARAWLAKIGLERVRGATLSCELGSIKPSPAVYADALARSGAAPEDAFFVDDRSINTEGARRVGISTLTYVEAPQARRGMAAWLKGRR